MKLSEDFETDKRYTLILSSDEIELPHETRGILEGLMTIQYYLDFPEAKKTFPMFEFIQSIEWRWLTNRGSLPKRIAKWYYDKYGKKLPDSISSAIGNIVRKKTVPNKKYHFDFTRDFTWEAGDFGDHESCFWESRSEIRDRMMDDPRFHAIRFFTEHKRENGLITSRLGCFHADKDTYWTGHSRAWFVRETITREVQKKVIEHTVYIVFNGYGMTTEQISSVFSSFLGVGYKVITVSNHKHLHKALYINDVGYLIGDKSILDQISDYDFSLNSYYDQRLTSRYSLTTPPTAKGVPAVGQFGFGKVKPRIRQDEDGRVIYHF